MGKEKLQTEPNVLKRLAHLLGTEVENKRLEIPEKFGKGYCAGFVFNEHIRMLILNYKLNENIVVENPDINASKKMILFKFQNVIPKTETLSTGMQLKAIPSVLIATRRMNTEIFIPIHTNTETINIEVDADYLNGLFDGPCLFKVYITLQKLI